MRTNGKIHLRSGCWKRSCGIFDSSRARWRTITTSKLILCIHTKQLCSTAPPYLPLCTTLCYKSAYIQIVHACICNRAHSVQNTSRSLACNAPVRSHGLEKKRRREIASLRAGTKFCRLTTSLTFFLSAFNFLMLTFLSPLSAGAQYNLPAGARST